MFTKSTRRIVGTTLALAFVCCVGGCSQTLVGTWKTDPAPKDVANYIVQAKFNKDGTYEATMKGEGEAAAAAPQKGQYEYNGFSLKLKTPGKTEQVYPAMYIIGDKLQVKQSGKAYMMKKQ